MVVVRKRDDRAQPVGPTPETARKLRADPLRLLLTRNALHPTDAAMNRRMFDAALDIAEAYRLVTAPVAMKPSSLERIDGRRGEGEERAREIDLKRRYDRWTRAMGAAGLPLGPVFDVVVEGIACHKIDEKWGRRNGRAQGLLRCALATYVVGI